MMRGVTPGQKMFAAGLIAGMGLLYAYNNMSGYRDRAGMKVDDAKSRMSDKKDDMITRAQSEADKFKK